jgi:hypothetical protein
VIAFMQVVAGCLSGYNQLSRAFTNDRGTYRVCGGHEASLVHFQNFVWSKCPSVLPRWQSREESRARTANPRHEAVPSVLHTL